MSQVIPNPYPLTPKVSLTRGTLQRINKNIASYDATHSPSVDFAYTEIPFVTSKRHYEMLHDVCEIPY